MATKFPILPHYPINANDQACLSALAVLAFVFICVYVLCWNVKHCDEPVLEKAVY